MVDSKRQAEVVGDLGKVSRHPEVTRAQAYIREQGDEIAALRKQAAEQEAQAAALRMACTEARDLVGNSLNWDAFPEIVRKSARQQLSALCKLAADAGPAGQALLDRQRELEEALRSMVTIYVGVIKDHFDQTTYNHVLEEPPVKRARILLGLEPAPAEQKGVEPG